MTLFPSSNLSFLESARPYILRDVEPYLIPDLAKIVADYAIRGKAFTPEDWKRVYRIEVEPLELGPEFYDWWFRPDAKDPIWTDPNVKKAKQLNCDTHLYPILCPETVLETKKLPPPAFRHRFASELDRTDFDLAILDRLVQNPEEGHPSRLCGMFDDSSEANRNTKTEPACYIVLRKELFARNTHCNQQIKYMEQLNATTNAGYEVLPRVLDLATALLVHHTVTGERYLGDRTGMENQMSYGSSEDRTTDAPSSYLMLVGGHRPFRPGMMGGPAPSGGLQIYDDLFGSASDVCGVPGVRKFPAKKPLSQTQV